MAYRLKRRKPVDSDLVRIVRKEFEKAQACLNGNADGHTEDAIHEARKGVKKIRAVLRLVRDELGQDYDAQNGELRQLAHQLSSLRDVDATAEMFDAMRHHYSRIVTPSIAAPVREAFLRRKRTATARLHPDRLMPRAARTLDQLASMTTKAIRRVADRSSTRAGVLQGYRRARKAMAEVRANPDDTQFHAWRRRVKDHEYQVRLLEGLSAPARARAQRLNRLETWLGDDHNLVLMRTTILDAPAQFGDTRTTAIVLGCAERYQAVLRRKAFKLGDRLFTTRPRNFRRSIDRWLQPR
jgi:CHAD domain-containing protein